MGECNYSKQSFLSKQWWILIILIENYTINISDLNSAYNCPETDLLMQPYTKKFITG